MFRVTIHDDPRCLTFQVEGRLAGDWVRELQDCWQSTLARRAGGVSPLLPMVCVDLAGVTFVDAAGKTLLAQLHRAGAKLVASGVLMRAVVAEMTQEASTPEGNRGTEVGRRKEEG